MCPSEIANISLFIILLNTSTTLDIIDDIHMLSPDTFGPSCHAWGL